MACLSVSALALLTSCERHQWDGEVEKLYQHHGDHGHGDHKGHGDHGHDSDGSKDEKHNGDDDHGDAKHDDKAADHGETGGEKDHTAAASTQPGAASRSIF